MELEKKGKKKVIIIIMENVHLYLKVNIKMEKYGMEKEKNIIIKVN